MRFGGSWLILALAAAWLATAGTRPLLEPDEARYAEIPREMQASGDWVTPRLNGLVYIEKPPLQYWGTALFYSLVGVHEWSARLWAVAGALLSVPLCAALARRLYGSDEAALAAGAVLATSPVFVIVGQLNLLDGAFTTLLTAAVFAFVAGQIEPEARRSRRLVLLAWPALGLAVLSKGIVALLLPGATLVAYSLVTRDLGPWRRLRLLPGLALFGLVTVPWFWAVSARNPEFLYFFFVHEHFARFLTTVHHRSRPIWYFVPVLLGALLPWLTSVPAALRAAFASDADAFRPGVFLALYCGIVFAFFSVSGSKLVPYILPCLPAAAVLLAPQLVGAARARALALAVTCALLAIAAIALLVRGARAEALGAASPALAGGAIAALAIAFAGGVAGRWLRGRDSAPARWAPLALTAVLGWQAVLSSYSALPPLRTARPLAEAVRGEIGPETRLYSVGQYRQSLPPYLGRTLRLAAYRGELGFGLERAPELALPTVQAFGEEWATQTDAIAFLDRDLHAKLVARGLPGRIIASDAESVAIARR